MTKVEGGDPIGRGFDRSARTKEMILEQSGVAEEKQGGRMGNPGLVGGGFVPSNSGTFDSEEACKGECYFLWWRPFAKMDRPLAPKNTEGTPFAKQFLAIQPKCTMAVYQQDFKLLSAPLQ